mmetsp:Transcript_2281/g.6834  ORF Transcript_2281/g.6834 Transcript_2281/m.6834 type:complete len:678 (+) Transcript_2281:135-2168(+)
MQLVLHPAPNWYSSSILDVNYYGSLVAVGTRNTVTFFDAATGRIEGELSVSGSERIVGVKFNRAPGLRHVLATAGSDGSVKVWDADARREIRRIARLSGPVGNVEFSAIAPHVLVAANSRGELVTYHLDQKEPAPNYASLGELSPSPVRSLASTPPRKVEENDYSCAEMAAGREDGCICIIEVIDGALLAFDKAPGPVHAVGWNSSGDGVVAACKGFSVAVWTWDRPHRRLVKTRTVSIADRETRKVTAGWTTAAWLPSGPVVCSSPEKTIAVVGSGDGRQESEDAHRGTIFSLAVHSADGRPPLLYSTSMDRTIGVWSWSKAIRLQEIWQRGIGKYVKCLGAHSRSKIVALLDDGSFRLLVRGEDPDDTDGQLSQWTCSALKPPAASRATLLAVEQAAPPDANTHPLQEDVHLCLYSDDRRIRVARVDEGSELLETAWTSDVLNSAVTQLTWERGSQRFFSVSESGQVSEWSISDTGGKQKLLVRQRSLTTPVCAMHLSPGPIHSSLFAAVDDSDTAFWWREGEQNAANKVTVGARCLAWSLDAQREPILAVGTSSGTVVVACLGTATGVKVLGQHGTRISALTWSPFCEDMLMSRASDWTIQVWNTGREPQNGHVNLRGHTGHILSAEWLSETEVASSSDDHTVRVWDLRRHSHTLPPLPQPSKRRPRSHRSKFG